MFIGATVTILALWGAWTTWHHAATRGFALAAGLSLLYALGANTPRHRLLYDLLPALDKARTPVRGLFIFAFAISGLAAIGFSELASVPFDRSRRIRFLILSISVAMTSIAAPYLIETPKVYRLEASNYLFLAIVSTALLLVICVSRLPSWLRFVIPTFAVLIELTTVSSLRVSPLVGKYSVCAADLISLDELVTSLRAHSKGGRVGLQGDFVRTSLGDQYQLNQLTSFVAGVPTMFLTLDLSSQRTQKLLGVNLIVTGQRSDWNAPPQHIVLSEQPGLPPAWVSHSVIGVTGEEELRAKIADESIPLPQTAILLGPEPHLSGSLVSESVELDSVHSDMIVLRFNLD
jgi:hypothetical protein